MLKTLISLSVLTSGFTVTPILTNIQNINIKNQELDSQSIQYVNKDIIIDNTKNQKNLSNQKQISGSEDLHLAGPNTDTRYRILMNSNGNKVLPKIEGEKVNDYLIGKGKKDTWYNHLIKGLSIDVTNYASNKTEFLKKYKAITFSYSYMINFWNSWYDWTYQYGKSGPLLVGLETYALTSGNTEKSIFNKSDSSHSNNEHAKLVVKQEWNGNILKYNFYLSVWYHWQAGSTVDHAAVAAFKGDEYTFTSLPANENDKTVKVTKLEKVASNFMMNSSEEILLNNFDDAIKKKAKETEIKNAWFKTASIMVQGYYGSKQVGNTVYIYSLIVRWSPQNGLGTKDSTLLLNGIDLTRTISVAYSNGQFHLNYENSFGDKQETISSPLNSNLIGTEMKGEFCLPFIYAQ